MSRRMNWSVAVGTQGAGIALRGAAGDKQDKSGACNRAHHLGHYITGGFRNTNAPGQDHSQRHRGINVASRYGSDSVDHGHQRKAKSQGDAQVSHKGTGKYSRAQARKHQHQGAK